MAVLLRVVRENDVVRSRQAWKKFELSLISGMAAFSLSFDARSQSLLLLPSKQFFTVDRAASLLMSTRVYPITESSVLVVVLFTAQPAQQSKKRGERSELNFTCVCERVYILWNWNGKGGGVLSSALEGREGGILKISSRDSTVRCSSFPWQLINSTVFALACWQAFLTGSSSRWWALATAFPFPFFSCLF